MTKMTDQKPTVLLLHSSAGSARQWQDLVKLLTPQFRVHAVDFHGHGDQRAWEGDAPLTLADDAQLAAPVLAEAGSVHVIGHSYGAAVALKLASMYPARVRSLATYEPVLFGWLVDAGRERDVQDVIPVAAAMREQLASNGAHAAARVFIDFWSGSGVWDSSPRPRQDYMAARMPAVLRHFDALFREPIPRSRLPLLQMPKLMMTGAQTMDVARRMAALLRSLFPLAQHEMLDAMGHMGPVTHAGEVNRRLVDFLRADVASNPIELLAEAA
jgi:pimeloyl-ACP methyl ester carboxylesterase